MSTFGVNIFGQAKQAPKTPGAVGALFSMPPFTVLDGRSGPWMDRKRMWIDIGIKSEIGRNLDDTCFSGWQNPSRTGVQGGRESEDKRKYIKGRDSMSKGAGSIFDPVIAELSYKWFCPEGGQIVDPFAGGSVRGVVASRLGFDYWGCDLRQEQIDANIEQGKILCQTQTPVWVCGDSLEELDNAPDADFVFSCPPYGDLEEYSDDARDISTLAYKEFVPAYAAIISKACKRLKNNRFAAFLVGNFRDKKTGALHDFIGDTVRCFEAAGCCYYNDSAYLTPLGTAMLRVTKQFASGRKFARTHQSLVVFCKGDWRKACAALPGFTKSTDEDEPQE